MTRRLLAAVVVLPAVLVLAACGGGSTGAQPAHTPSITTQTASEPAAQPDKLTGPAPADQEVNELTGFPGTRHDDQVDSVSQFLKWAALRKFLDASTLVVCGPKVFRDGIQIN